MKNSWSNSLAALTAILAVTHVAAAADPTNAAAGAVPAPDAAPTPAATPAPAPAPSDAADEARLKALETQLADLRRRLDASDAAAAHATEAAKAPAPAAPAPTKPHWYDSVQLSAYAQAQLEFHQDSEDQLAVGGQPLNQNRFLLRRGRLKLESEHRYASFLLELDGNTVKGPSFGVQRAEVSVLYRGSDATSDKTPLIAVSAGVLLPWFGRELQESPRLRPWMERTLASRAFFPSEPDVGVRLWGTLGFFNYSVAVLNGEPAGQPVGFPLRDPNSAKDLMARLGVAADASKSVKASGGVSLLNGTSTFRGTDGTKSVVTWVDTNEDGQLQNVELGATPGSAPRRSENFKHWAVDADADVQVETGIGKSELQAELVIANNLDRGQFISDPVTARHDERQLGFYVGFLQDITEHALVGFRYDYYDPRADVLGSKNGKIVPIKASIKTFSPLIGFRLPSNLKLLGQWDIIRDHLATDDRGVPADRKNNVVTVRLQGEL